MKRGGMYRRDMRAMPGCLVALLVFSIVAYVICIAAVASAVTNLLA